jgi:GNAT superfamily N-acetyltransferase
MITYRPATAHDTPHVLALLEEIMRHHGVAPPEPEPLGATVATILDSPGHLLLVADDGGRLVGMCALIFSQSTWSASPVCELQDVLVTSGRRRGAIGRGLVQAAERIAKDRRCTRLFLLAEYWNLDAHTFYRSLGLAEKTCLYFELDLRGEPPALGG